MAKKRVVKKARKARRNIRIDVSSDISKKDMENMQKFKCTMKNNVNCGCGGAIYGLGFIGALVYYISTATSVWDAIIGFFQAILWPAFLVFSAMHSLGM